MHIIVERKTGKCLSRVNTQQLVVLGCERISDLLEPVGWADHCDGGSASNNESERSLSE